MVLPEERIQVEQQIEMSKRAVVMFADEYAKADYTVLWPEVEFFTPIPGTEHHCHFVHRILHPKAPPSDPTTGSPEPCKDERCFHPIYFTGRTDAVITLQSVIWLLETKTSAMTGNIFFDRFYLDFQPTGYLYGIWKQTGVRPHGFLLNVVKKPQKRAADQFNVTFEREPYLRTDEDLQRFEHELIIQAQDYEDAWEKKRIYMNTKSCTNYNRRCYFWDLCKRHGEMIDGEFRLRNRDYVDLAYYKLLGLEVPQDGEVVSPA
jgi:hypothetical protein